MIRNNRKGKVVPVHALRAYRGSGGVGPPNLLFNGYRCLSGFTAPSVGI